MFNVISFVAEFLERYILFSAALSHWSIFWPNLLFLLEHCSSISRSSDLADYFQDTSGQNVAIKCIKKKSLSKRGADNLITEIQVLKDLKHRHIVQLYDFTVSQSRDQSAISEVFFFHMQDLIHLIVLCSLHHYFQVYYLAKN